MKQDRAYRVVIRNLHYSIPIDEIKEELQKKGHAVRNILNIRHRVNKYPLSMFYVDLEPKENNKEIYNLQYLNNMKINVEPPYKKIPSFNVQDVSSMATQKYHPSLYPSNLKLFHMRTGIYIYIYINLCVNCFVLMFLQLKSILLLKKDLDIKTRSFFSRLNCEQCIIIMSRHPITLELN